MPARARRSAPRAGPVVLIDGVNTLIRSHVALGGLATLGGVQTGAMLGVVRAAVDVIRRFDPAAVVVVWEGGRSAWRRAVFPEYKNRPPSSDRARWDAAYAQVPAIASMLTVLGVDCVRVDGVEADDVIAALALRSHAARRVLIYSTDRDFWQLIDRRVSVTRSLSQQGADGAVDVLDATSFAVHVSGVPSVETPDDYLLYRVVNGDPSDRIPRVAGLSGPQRFGKVFPVLRSMGVTTAADLIALDEPVSRAAPADKVISSRVVAAWSYLRRNAVLMHLPFAVRMMGNLDVDAAVTRGRWDERAAMVQCARFEFATVMRDMEYVKRWACRKEGQE